MVKLLLEHGSDPNLANEKEQTPLDVCPNEHIRQILTTTTAKTKLTRQSVSEDQTAETELPIPSAHSHSQPSPLDVTDVTELKLEEKQEPVEEDEGKGRDEEDSAFLPDPQSIPRATAAQPICGTTAKNTTPPQQLAEGTPSRTRRRGKRERGFPLKGKGHGDVSSSESESELLVTARKVPRLVDRLPSSVEEGSSADEQLVSEASVTVQEEGRKGEGEGERERKGSDVEVEANTNQEDGTLDNEKITERDEGKEEEDEHVTSEEEEPPEKEVQVANEQEDKKKIDSPIETAAEENLTSMYNHYSSAIVAIPNISMPIPISKILG